MAERRIVAALYVDEESILGKIAEIDNLATRLHHESLDLKSMIKARKAADVEEKSAAEND